LIAATLIRRYGATFIYTPKAALVSKARIAGLPGENEPSVPGEGGPWSGQVAVSPLAWGVY
jgi:hypothetical protein